MIVTIVIFHFHGELVIKHASEDYEETNDYLNKLFAIAAKHITCLVNCGNESLNTKINGIDAHGPRMRGIEFGYSCDVEKITGCLKSVIEKVKCDIKGEDDADELADAMFDMDM